MKYNCRVVAPLTHVGRQLQMNHHGRLQWVDCLFFATVKDVQDVGVQSSRRNILFTDAAWNS